jgi:hypothetical protein
MQNEQWKRIKGLPGILVSDQGNVKTDRGIVKSQRTELEGYKRVTIAGETVRTHKLVAKAFIPNPKRKPCINHKNGIKTDNRACNLEWSTERENSLLASKCGLLHGGTAPTPIIVEKILDNTKYEFQSQAEAARKLHISDSEINKCLKGKRKTSHGYTFQYKEDNTNETV